MIIGKQTIGLILLKSTGFSGDFIKFISLPVDIYVGICYLF